MFPDSLTAITPRTPPSTLTIDEHRALLAEAMDYMLRAQADAHRAAIETTHSTARAAAHATAHAAEPPLDMDALTERLRSIVGDATSTVDYSTFRDPQYDQAPDIPHDEAAIIDGSFEFPWMTSDLTNTPNPYGTE